MKFGDQLIYGSTENIKGKLREIVKRMTDNVYRHNEKEEMDYVLISTRNLTNHTLILFERLIAYQQAPIEFCAISARNLFECYLLVAFILSDPSKAKDFVGQKAAEELEFNEGFLSITKPNTPESTIQAIRDRMAYIKDLMSQHGIPVKKGWNVRELAEKANNKIEYEAFFKLYSKYVHPSSWIVNGVINEYDNPVFRNIFIMQGQHYASCVLKLVSDYYRDQLFA
ncbi:MAG: DUF5677 domain-containing protein [Chitinophagaceae bacterium]